MGSSDDGFLRLNRAMDDINQLEVEEMARGGNAMRMISDQDHQLHLNMLRRRIQQQRSMVAKLSREDLEDQHLHALEELEIVKKESNLKDVYLKKLSTKILRLQRSETSLLRSDGRNGYNTAPRAEMEQKIRSLENQLKVSKVYGTSSLPRKGSKQASISDLNRSQTDLVQFRQQIHALEETRREEQEAHHRTVKELQTEIARTAEKASIDHARNNMLENMEITRLTRQLSKTTQDLVNMKNDYIEIRPKYEELQINRIVIARENERLKQEIDRHQQTMDALEEQLRQAREKALQQIHDQEKAKRLESELDWFKRQHQVITQQQLHPRQEPVVVDLNARVTEGVLRSQLTKVEEELQRETKECQDLRKRVTDREMEIEKSLADLSELRALNMKLRQECEEFRAKFEAANTAEPKKSEGWFRAPPGLGDDDISQAFLLHTAFKTRRSMGISTDPLPPPPAPPPAEKVVYQPDPHVLEELSQAQQDRNRLTSDLDRARDDFGRAREDLGRAKEALQAAEERIAQLENARQNLQTELERNRVDGSDRARSTDSELKELQNNLQGRTKELKDKQRLIDDLEAQLKDLAEGTVVYNLEEEIADQSRLSADNVVLQHGDNLLQLHFGPFSFNREFFTQAEAMRITKWRLKWSVFGENMFAQDTEKLQPDFDFTAIHCVTMDEQIMRDLAEARVQVEIVGCRGEFSRAFAYASFSCRKLLEDSYQRLSRVRGEIPLISQFSIGEEFGIMAYWMRMKFDIQETQAMYLARKKALNYVEDNLARRKALPSADAAWLQEAGSAANLFHIVIHGCRGIKALHSNGPPSPCVLYQFFNSKTVYTQPIVATENPQFNHDTALKVLLDDRLETYLRNEKLDIYVTDSNDPNQDHFLGYCQLSLVEILQRPIVERSVPLLTQTNQQNGTLVFSVYWEQPERLEQLLRPLDQRNGSRQPSQVNQVRKRNQPQTSSSRSLRASLTPRGSLVSVTHTSKLVKIDRPNYRQESLEENHDKTSQNQKRNKGREVGNINGEQNGRKNNNRVNSGNDVEARGNAPSKPERPPRRKTSELSDRKDSEKLTEGNRPRSLERRINSDTFVKRSIHPPLLQSPRKSEPSFVKQASSIEKSREKLSRRNSENEVVSARSRRTETFVRSTTLNGDERGDHKQTIQADVHPEQTEKKRPFRGFFETLAKKASIRKRNGGNAEVVAEVNHVVNQIVEAEVPQKSTMVRPDVVRVVVHSLYFVEGARILSDERPGEIFVLFELLGGEHESPLAIVKPEVADKELSFEFQKEFLVDEPTHPNERRLLSEMLRSSPPGRIPFSVYFQPDDESMDSELVGVSALSLNRLLTRNLDALAVELKMMSPVQQGVVVGYMKVSVEALGALLEIQQEDR